MSRYGMCVKSEAGRTTKSGGGGGSSAPIPFRILLEQGPLPLFQLSSRMSVSEVLNRTGAERMNGYEARL